MKTLVMKFGGSAGGTTRALAQVLSIVLHEQKRWDHIILVASALDGVTDMLLEAAHLAQIVHQRGYRRIAATLRSRHLALADQLPLGEQERSALRADIESLLFEMLDQCQQIANTPTELLSPQVSDSIIGVGERLSARIIAALLRQNHVRGVAIEGTDVIVTDAVFGNAIPNLQRSRERLMQHLAPMLERKIVPVVTGFIGATEDGIPTTLGRGGSDYTASVISACLNATELWIWTNVDGMMSTDPNEIPSARVIEKLTFDEVAELAYFGAHILHARMIDPLRNQGIPFRIKNVFKPQQAGTLVQQERLMATARLRAVTAIPALRVTGNRSGDVLDVIDLVQQAMAATTGQKPDVMLNTQSSDHSALFFVIPTTAGGADAVENVRAAVMARFSEFADRVVWNVEAVTIVTAIGTGFAYTTTLQAQILQNLTETRILGMAQGPSHCSFSVIVEEKDAEFVLRQIHNLVLSSG